MNYIIGRYNPKYDHDLLPTAPVVGSLGMYVMGQQIPKNSDYCNGVYNGLYQWWVVGEHKWVPACDLEWVCDLPSLEYVQAYESRIPQSRYTEFLDYDLSRTIFYHFGFKPHECPYYWVEIPAGDEKLRFISQRFLEGSFQMQPIWPYHDLMHKASQVRMASWFKTHCQLSQDAVYKLLLEKQPKI